MPRPLRSEVWLVDLGLAAKVRPCLVVSVPVEGNDRSLATVIAHTTSPRGSRFEAAARASFLREGVFDGQNIVTIPHAKLIRRLGRLPDGDFGSVLRVLCLWLGIRVESPAKERQDSPR